MLYPTQTPSTFADEHIDQLKRDFGRRDPSTDQAVEHSTSRVRALVSSLAAAATTRVHRPGTTQAATALGDPTRG
jgi:hypothetical protein